MSAFRTTSRYTGALRAALCAIAGVGALACGMVSLLVEVAVRNNVADHRCPGNLRVTVDNARCV